MEVFISQWAKEAAHNLDMRRETWLNRKSTVQHRDALKLKVGSNVNHAAIFIKEETELNTLRDAVSSDYYTLKTHLSDINSQKKIDGHIYPKTVFFTYRARIIAELNYKEMLLGVINSQLKYRRMFLSDQSNPKLSNVFGDSTEILPDDYLTQLHALFRRKMRLIFGKEWFNTLDKKDQELIESIDFMCRKKRINTLNK